MIKKRNRLTGIILAFTMVFTVLFVLPACEIKPYENGSERNEEQYEQEGNGSDNISDTEESGTTGEPEQGGSDTDTESGEDQSGSEYTMPYLTSKQSGSVINLIEGDVYEFAAKYEKLRSEKYCDGTDKFAPVPATIEWSYPNPADYYTVNVSLKKDLTDSETYVCFYKKLEIEDLFMGKRYYYRITAHKGNDAVRSRVFYFDTAYLPRTIDVENASNTRDMGGYYTVDGNHRIKQGMIYRGAAPELATAAGIKKLLNVYGIKTDLDLRGEKPTSAFGDSVKFINISAPYYMNWNGIHYESFKEAFITEIKAFADPSNYPMYVHCSLGRDRTGTICFLIGALCGMTERDLYLDYEMSYLSYWGSFGWDKAESPTVKVGQFTEMYKYINEGSCLADYPNYYTLNNKYLNGDEKSLAERTESYLKNYLGIKQSEIDAIRSILIEEI